MGHQGYSGYLFLLELIVTGVVQDISEIPIYTYTYICGVMQGVSEISIYTLIRPQSHVYVCVGLPYQRSTCKHESALKGERERTREREKESLYSHKEGLSVRQG